MPDSVLSVRGDKIVDGSGQPVILRGYNIGGWMNMENFLTGYPGTESQHRRVLRRVLGPELYDAFFEEFMTVFFDHADARYLASLGMNSVRIPFNYRHFEDDARPFELKESGFALLDRAVRHCQQHGLYAVLDFHALPGSQNQHWHSDNETHKAGFWVYRHFADRVVHLWEALAARYRGNAMVAGYNIMNEPADPDGDMIKPFYDPSGSASSGPSSPVIRSTMSSDTSCWRISWRSTSNTAPAGRSGPTRMSAARGWSRPPPIRPGASASAM